MPRDVTVTFEDGSQHKYAGTPDDVTPEQVSARALQEFGKSVTALDGGRAVEKPGPMQSLGNHIQEIGTAVGGGLKDLGRGAAKGLGGMLEGLSAFNDADRPPYKTHPLSDGRSSGEKVEDFLPTPKGDSEGRQALRSVLEGVGGAAVSGGRSAVNYASGAGAGLGGWLGEKVDPNTPIGKIVGSLLGGVAGGGGVAALGSARAQTGNLAREGLEGLTKEQLWKAQVYKNAMGKQGTPIDLAQALEATSDTAGNLKNIRDAAAKSTQGNKLQEMLRAQPRELQNQAEFFTNDLPGINYGRTQNANNLQKAATDSLQALKNERSELWKETLEGATNALRASEKASVADAKAFQTAAGIPLSKARAEVTKLQNELTNSSKLDTAAVTALNAKVASSRELIEKLSTFSLPRGQTSSNRGSLLELPNRGNSIINDSITREVQAGQLSSNLPPVAAPAPSVQTALKQQQLGAAQQEVGLAEKVAQSAAQRTENATAGLQSVDQVPVSAVQAQIDRLRELAATTPNTSQGTMLTRLAGRMETQAGPITDPTALNKVLQEAAVRLKSPDLLTKGIDAGTSKFIGGQITATREGLAQTFDPLRKANANFSRYTDEVYNPVKQGPVGNIAGRGYAGDKAASPTRIEGLLEAGTERTAKTSDISTAVAELGKNNPEAFESAFKGWVTRKVEALSKPETLDNPLGQDGSFLKGMENTFFQDKLKYQGMKDAIAGMAKVRGNDPDAAVRGLEHLRQLTKAMNSRPAGDVGATAAEIARMGGSSGMANMMQLFSMVPVSKAARGFERFVLGKTLEDFDNILTSPRGVETLIKLGNTPVMSKKAIVILGTYGGTMGSVDPVTPAN